MRHSRRAVMAEQYKLYMKKNIFNGRYFVRNLQISICVILVITLIIGTVVLTHFDKEEQIVTADAGVSVKEALFGNSEEKKKVTKKQTATEVMNEQDTEIATEENTEEIIKTESTEQVSTQENVTEAVEETHTVEEINTTEEKSTFDGKCIANVDETLNVRKEPSADAEFAGSMNRGAIAKVESTEGEWTKVKSGDVEGYVLTQYILIGKDAEKFAEDYVTLRGSVLEDGVNIRAKKSTDAEIVVVLDKDDTFTVLEKPEENKQKEDVAGNESKKTEQPAKKTIEQTQTEQSTETTEQIQTEDYTDAVNEDSTENDAILESENTEESTAETTESQTEQNTAEKETEQKTAPTPKTDDITWLSVMLEDGRTGYVSADLVNVEELYEIAVSAEELERKAAEEAAAKKAAEEEAARQAAAKQAAAQTANSRSNSEQKDSYKGATTTPVTTSESGECIGTFTITAYCGCKKCSGGGKKTASGTTPTEGRTIAADTSVLPFGTKVVIGGVVYTVEDCGSGVNGNHIDIFFATHSKAVAFGKKSMKVYRY